MASSTKLSLYGQKLPPDAKSRYLQKLQLISGVDPFCSSFLENHTSVLPPVDASDIVAYLVLQTSYLTAKQFKAHKSMEGYNQFVCGWVKDVQSFNVNGKFVVTARVRHSQRSNEPPLKNWLICEKSGAVCCAHCNCMAGLGEACTHVAAVLFYLETASRIDGTSSCTKEHCRWVIPAYQKEIPYLPICKIDFSSPNSKKKSIDTALQNSSQFTSGPLRSSLNLDPPSEVQLDSFFDALSDCGTRPAILSLISKHAENYIPKSQQNVFPTSLLSLADPAYIGLQYGELLEICDNISFTVLPLMAEAVEKATRDQSGSRLWYTFRAGRVTASRMKQVCRTSIVKPAKSLLKTICYPQSYRFSTVATRWGCDHEKVARDHYCRGMAEKHEGFTVEESGFVINPTWPHIGASPDGIINCICCGKGTLEIKCLYCHRGDDIETVAQDPKACLVTSDDNSISLNRSHAYYYQVLTQVHVCHVDYGDFCLCTFPNGQESPPSIHIERILSDDEAWEQCTDKATLFFKKCIMPEITAKYFTQSTTPITVSAKQALHDHTYSKSPTFE